MPAASAAAWKLPNRFRTVRSHGLMPAAVQESCVGIAPDTCTKRRTASRVSASRAESSVSHSQASPLNTPGRFGKWELGSRFPPPNPALWARLGLSHLISGGFDHCIVGV
jgi:hypothetical protein